MTEQGPVNESPTAAVRGGVSLPSRSRPGESGPEPDDPSCRRRVGGTATELAPFRDLVRLFQTAAGMSHRPMAAAGRRRAGGGGLPAAGRGPVAATRRDSGARGCRLGPQSQTLQPSRHPARPARASAPSAGPSRLNGAGCPTASVWPRVAFDNTAPNVP